MARLREQYVRDLVPQLMKAFGYKNVMQVPKLEKVVVNVGAGDAKDNAKLMDQIVAELALITGQKPVVTKAKKSIANFHLREGMPVGCKVTLRGDRMYEFLDRMISVALPRVRDFKGVSGKGFDGRGNYTLGLTEQIIFPEVDLEKVEKVKGMNVCIATTAKTDEECKELLRLFGMPFRH
ncbi:MAG: 50S ribosomal protein L5 [Deltaproteobacteria bacterium]|nr:50S ribosomal protein L5 [Deltaproteobacteria bacterium]